MALASVKAEEIIPEGIAIIPSPNIRMTKVKILPPIVMGTMSPYPTVVKVTTDHHILENIEENASGWTLFSK
tara:strand:- start:3 stop:218 length:216 start_codon:yes stop_codon:yes gene_type:complete